MKYVVITGGVVSSLGKGIASASLARLLESHGLKVGMIKLDPYINVDPGTMNPFQHGEVYVTDDGAETDLDLGHYERFTSAVVGKENNATTGQIYHEVITAEREGRYLGGTVQVVPHITDEIKRRIRLAGARTRPDVLLVEIGGTVGDIEGMPFLEAVRQLRLEAGADGLVFVHVTLIPLIESAGELKTKPTQHSVASLREIGIQPDILLCRTSRSMSLEMRRKISLFCNVDEEAVIEARDVASIYEVPLNFQDQGVDRLIMRRLKLKGRGGNMRKWRTGVVEAVRKPRHELTVAVVGKYIHLQDAYKSIYEALAHGGIANRTAVKVLKVDAEELERDGAVRHLRPADGVLVPGGFGTRGIEGKIAAITYARKEGLPFLGICLGMQCAVIEFARSVLGLKRANSTEFDRKTPHPVISLLEEQRKVSKLGGTMRLGAFPCVLKAGCRSAKAYGKRVISERHRHRYEFNNAYRARIEAAGMCVCGTYEKGGLVEMVELKDHPWFVACQFHPEFKSKPDAAHPLFRGLVQHALLHQQGRL